MLMLNSFIKIESNKGSGMAFSLLGIMIFAVLLIFTFLLIVAIFKGKTNKSKEVSKRNLFPEDKSLASETMNRGVRPNFNLKPILPLSVYQRVEASPLLKLAVHAFLGLIVFSLMGLLVNLVINFEAFKFQWGISRRVDTALLNDYKMIRNIFLFVGLFAGLASVFIPQKKIVDSSES